jgi:sugar phosphate isomerase/epimerase
MKGADGFYTAGEIRSRLSVSTLAFWQYRPIGPSTLGELCRCGLRQIELLESPEQFDMADSKSMRHIGEMCRSCGVEVVAYHAHKTSFSELDTETKRIERVDHCRRQIDTMIELGGHVWGCHAAAADPTLVRCYEDLARHVEHTEAFVAVENFIKPGLWIEDRMAFLREIPHPRVGLILDIGHVRDSEGVNPMTVPGGPKRILEACADRLVHLHLHGFVDGRDHFPPLTEGDAIQWVELFRLLRAKGYTGLLNFEPAGEPKHPDALQATAAFPGRIVEMETRSRRTGCPEGDG